MNRVDNDWLLVEAEDRQSWPPKTDKLAKLKRQKKEREKTKYIVIHKLAKNTKNIDTTIILHQTT